VAVENFDSLRDTLQEALQKKFGKDHYLDEFSTKHAIFTKPGEKTQRRIPYSIENGGIKFTGKHEPVKRATGYERVNKAVKEKVLQAKTLGAPEKGTLQD